MVMGRNRPPWACHVQIECNSHDPLPLKYHREWTGEIVRDSDMRLSTTGNALRLVSRDDEEPL
jgi:hypothetical protein